MDYRNRKYYLVTLSSSSYDIRLNHFKMFIPTLKISEPYNHFKNGKSYDGENTNKYWQMMISCRNEHAEALEYELNKDKRQNEKYSYFMELNKQICGQ